MLSEAERNKAADILIKAEKERKQAVQLSDHLPEHRDRGFLRDLDRGRATARSRPAPS